MSNTNLTDEATGLVNDTLSAAGHAIGSAASSVPSIAAHIVGSTGADVTSTADSITIASLQPS